MIKVSNITLSEEIILEIVNFYNSIIPTDCGKLKIYNQWDKGLELIITTYAYPIKKICIWNNNLLNVNSLSYCDTIILYLSMKRIIGEDKVQFI